ncbi:3-dehydroquinate dehydratase [Pseudoclavibacter alba]|uniref:3-dehydroquinate dehydratase n=1 Tax=Pseudoclavibacter albus TaxID=272241 RepID=A0ABT2HUH5_9MICO|nr:type II 3-dehydroquinate dehydratase [Pseudoclavibacter alba]MBN6777945.1 3-dehydroquinate dehydratase [Pseudoclavibacter alba]MCT2041972.1 3-dehydroquinate dehydratase [Pseudoclavibacter alba]
MRILVLNGPNLNRLGTREPGIYGALSEQDILERLKAEAPEVEWRHVQSQHEGVLIEALHEAADTGTHVIFNPAGYTHTSVSLRDAVALTVEAGSLVVEVHLSNPAARESFRHTSLISAVASGTIAGFGAGSYSAALHVIRSAQ